LSFITEAEDDARNSHLLFTLNVYQYKVDHGNSGQEEGKSSFSFSLYVISGSVFIFSQATYEQTVVLVYANKCVRERIFCNSKKKKKKNSKL